jgi:polar amino acid transport system substrate-binding protein
MTRFLTALAAACVASVAGAQTIILNTEAYPPLNYEENGAIVGIGGDQVREMMARTGLDHRIEITSWSRAITLAEERPEHCVFTAAHTAERDPRFVWIEPLHVMRSVLARAAGGPEIADLEAARAYRVGGQLNDVVAVYLEEHGFDVDTSGAVENSISKLEAGRIDLVGVAEETMRAFQKRGARIETALVLSEDILSVACHPETDPAAVAAMRAALAAMIAEGVQTEIVARYE